MKLEDEIKQVKFKSHYHKLAVNIIYTHGWLDNLMSPVFKELDITPQQFNILRILKGQHPNPATINLLKERMLDKMSDASRLVERLRCKELVERETCDDDRRRVDVKITQKGLDLLEKYDARENDFSDLFKNLTEEEIETLNNYLDKLRG